MLGWYVFNYIELIYQQWKKLLDTGSSSFTLSVPKIYVSHWMLEEYSVRTDPVHTDAAYTTTLDLLLTDDYDHGTF